MPLLSGLTACWRWLRPCAGCGWTAAGRAAAGCLMAVLMMRMIRAGRAGPGEDGHDERGGEAAVGAGREQGPGVAPGPARRRLRAPVHDGAGHRARRIDAAAVRAVRARGGAGLGAVPGPGDR